MNKANNRNTESHILKMFYEINLYYSHIDHYFTIHNKLKTKLTTFSNTILLLK